MKRYKNIFIILFLMLSSTIAYAEDNLTIEQITELKNSGLISQEDFQILYAELTGSREDEQLYKLSVNNILLTDKFKVKTKGKVLYFPLFDFIEILGFFNQKQIGNTTTISLREDFKLVVDMEKKNIEIPNRNELNKKLKVLREWIIEDTEDMYIEEGVFKEIFLKALFTEKSDTYVRMQLGFDTPEEAAILFKVRQEELLEQLNQNEIIYTSEKKLVDIGNARVELFQNFDKKEGDNKYEKDWEGRVEYQGALLYGEVSTNYDFKTKKLGNIELRYDEFYKEHGLTFGAYSTPTDSREFGIKLRKNKGYFELGKKFIITETVPVGSKVELIYMGYPIETQDAVNGRVTFDNPMIKANRSYTLKIHSPNGDIETKHINTAQNYNQQDKGEIEYDISFKEDKESKKYNLDSSIYYGLTKDLTLGVDFGRTPEERDNRYEFLDEGGLQLTYSKNLFKNRVPLTLQFGTDRTLTSSLDSQGKDYSDRYKNNALIELDINSLRVKYEHEQSGKYYTNKSTNRYETEYTGLQDFTFAYEYNETNYRNGTRDDETKYRIGFDKGITQNLLFSSEIVMSDKSDEEYRADLYYTGFCNFNINWKNNWTEKLENYETELELSTNNFFDMFDYTFSVAYSEQNKERFTLTFDIDYANFFKFTGSVGDRGNRNFRVGVDRVVDLRNITRPLDDIRSSRVKVIAFVDKNDNNIWDKGEERVENVEVKLGGHREITDSDGETMFYGVSNDIVLDLEATIRKPSYSLGNNIIKIKGNNTSTIIAYIPVKPMLTLEGRVQLDESIVLKPEELQQLYNEIFIRVVNKKGEEVELNIPDEDGNFIFSGIFPDEYTLEVEYFGQRYKLPKLKEKMRLRYEGDSTLKVILEVEEDKFILDKKFGGKN